ncbi:MAG: TIM-barrel domain-containing protein [Caulobacteraceae bacterium]
MAGTMSRREAIGGLVAGAAAAPGASASAGPPELAFTVSAVSPTCIRLERIGDGSAPPEDGVLARPAGPRPTLTLSLSRARTLRCGGLKLVVLPGGGGLRIEASSGRVVQQIRFEPDGFAFRLGDGPLFGLGQGGPQFDRRGDVDPMTSGQGGYELKTHGSRQPVQWLVGASGFGLFVHQPLGRFDLSGAEGRFISPGPAAPALDLFISGAGEPAGVMADYARITGLPEMPPKWSLGYQQSHRTLGSPEDIITEARRFREAKLPCDAMIYLGTGFCPNGWNTDNGEFAWNPRAFPDPKAAIDQLHALDFKVVLHAVIEGHHLTGRVTDPCTAPPLPSGRTPDGHWPPDRQASCYWPVHKPLVDLGVDGWWPDQGDGLDPVSRLNRNRMYFEGQQLYRPNRRVYALHRNTWAGMQRFAAFLWSGDVASTWETLKTHVPVGINTGLSGIPYWGTDIGGFVPTEEYTSELFVRWFQFAAFNPLFRSHGRDWRMHLPWGWSDGVRGPPETPKWNPDPQSLHDPRVEPICRKYLELRYRLMPYLYTAVRETCDTGLPIMRAMWLHYPHDPAASARGDQYLYGRDLLVAPVVERGAASRSLYLPEGVWYDFWTHEKLEGGREIARPVGLEDLPLYVRAGAVIPLGPVVQHTGEASGEPLELWVHPGADGGGVVYEDDGESFDYRRGRFTRMTARWSDERRELILSQSGAASSRRVRVRLAGSDQVREASVGRGPTQISL